MKRSLILMIILFLLTMAWYLMLSGPHVRSDKINAVQGSLNLKNWNFKQDEIVRLAGQWEYYPNQLLTAEQMDTAIRKRPVYYRELTSSKLEQLSNVRTSSLGVATYRLIIELPAEEQYYGFHLNDIKSAFSLYINGKPIMHSGTVSLYQDTYQPKIESKYVYAYLSGTTELILHVANFDNPTTGLMYHIELGTQERIQIKEFTGNTVVMLCAILSFLCAVYYFSLYFFYQKYRHNLYLGFLFLAIVAATLNSGLRPIYLFFPDISYYLVEKLLYLAVSLIFLAIIYFIDSINPKFMPGIITAIFKITAYFSIALIYIMPLPIYFTMLPYVIQFIGACFLIILFLLIRFLWDLPRNTLLFQENILYLLGMLALGTFILNQALYTCNWVSSILVGQFAIFILIICVILSMPINTIVSYQEQRKMEQIKNDFLYNAMYLLNAPIKTIQALTNFGVPVQMDHEFEQRWLHVQESSHQLSRRIQDITDLTMIQNGELRLSLNPVSLHAAIQFAIDQISYKYQIDHIQFQLQIAEDIIVLADETRLPNIFVGLIAAALDTMETGYIRFDGTQYKERFIVQMTYTGKAIPFEEQAHLFELHTRVDQDDAGITMFLAQRLMQLMGGKIQLTYSNRNGETCLSLMMQLSHETDGFTTFLSTPMTKLKKHEFPVDTPKQSMICLIVDDDIHHIETAKSILEASGYHIFWVMNEEEARESILQNSIDVMILDSFLNGRSTLPFVQSIREQYTPIELPILLSHIGMKFDMDGAMIQGANDMIEKPFEASSLLPRIRTLIAMRRFMIEAVKGEMAFLQTQIKPHFLYNAINTIVSFCYTDGERAADLLINLSNYLRMTFAFENKMTAIPIQQEIDLVNAYFAIQRARFGEQIKLRYDVEPLLLANRIPSFIIQPLVENAIRHGISVKEHGGTVVVRIHEEHSMICIAVEDDGVGMTTEQIQRLRNLESKGVGIKNILKRSKHWRSSNLSIESVEGKGTTVTLWLRK